MILECYDDERYFANRQALLRLAKERHDACMAAVEQARAHGVAARISIPDPEGPLTPEGFPTVMKQIPIGPWHVELARRAQFALLCDLQDATGVARVADIPFVEQGRFQLL